MRQVLDRGVDVVVADAPESPPPRRSVAVTPDADSDPELPLPRRSVAVTPGTDSGPESPPSRRSAAVTPGTDSDPESPPPRRSVAVTPDTDSESPAPRRSGTPDTDSGPESPPPRRSAAVTSDTDSDPKSPLLRRRVAATPDTDSDPEPPPPRRSTAAPPDTDSDPESPPPRRRAAGAREAKAALSFTPLTLAQLVQAAAAADLDRLAAAEAEARQALELGDDYEDQAAEAEQFDNRWAAAKLQALCREVLEAQANVWQLTRDKAAGLTKAGWRQMDAVRARRAYYAEAARQVLQALGGRLSERTDGELGGMRQALTEVKLAAEALQAGRLKRAWEAEVGRAALQRHGRHTPLGGVAPAAMPWQDVA